MQLILRIQTDDLCRKTSVNIVVGQDRSNLLCCLFKPILACRLSHQSLTFRGYLCPFDRLCVVLQCSSVIAGTSACYLLSKSKSFDTTVSSRLRMVPRYSG